MISGITITPQGCQATDFGPNAVIIQCPATLTNTGTDTLVIGVASIDSTGAISDIRPLQLLPGVSSVIPAPPAGCVWLIAAQTQGHINWVADWYILLATIIGGLAGLGFAGLVRWLIRRHD